MSNPPGSPWGVPQCTAQAHKNLPWGVPPLHCPDLRELAAGCPPLLLKFAGSLWLGALSIWNGFGNIADGFFACCILSTTANHSLSLTKFTRGGNVLPTRMK